jgi:hypothetical protein
MTRKQFPNFDDKLHFPILQNMETLIEDMEKALQSITK